MTGRTASEIWIRRGCAVVVAAVAAYASYEHQRAFAFHGGADPTSAALWPLSVDGLLLLATTSLLKPSPHTTSRTRYAVLLAFWLGIAVSLAANIAAAPTLSWQPILVAGWPPLALLFAVELLAHRPIRHETGETYRDTTETHPEGETTAENERWITLDPISDTLPPPGKPRAWQIMWTHYQREQARGRTPTGAELDRVAGTNNYGRAVLARWRRNGHIPTRFQ
ncbi:DUF2637 domain-containing protein [Streptomyces phytophilus]|uniref:DUF2637 domain-containing protein n=1 Tax=Streptomyces phytophilus TaxID=722715 RepID=UPI0015EFF779|nr:DUF2637 domain-containing protein [Streptomyces phytophilus]